METSLPLIVPQRLKASFVSTRYTTLVVRVYLPLASKTRRRSSVNIVTFEYCFGLTAAAAEAISLAVAEKGASFHGRPEPVCAGRVHANNPINNASRQLRRSKWLIGVRQDYSPVNRGLKEKSKVRIVSSLRGYFLMSWNRVHGMKKVNDFSSAHIEIARLRLR